jgi:hypothetical protein
MTLSVAIVCEAEADREAIATLAERLVLEAAAQSAPWIDGPDSLPFYCRWRGFRASDTHLRWTDLKHLAEELSILVRFRNEPPLHPYSQNAYRAILVLARSPDPVDAIILVPDSDGDPDRLKGLEQARRYAKSALPIVIGMAHTKRECWHAAGFRPESGDEQAIVDELRQQLGHEPWLRTEELTASHEATQDKRSAKRVLKALCQGDRERERRCLTRLPIAELCQCGADNGLAAFVAELRAHLVPQVLGRSRPTPS